VPQSAKSESTPPREKIGRASQRSLAGNDVDCAGDDGTEIPFPHVLVTTHDFTLSMTGSLLTSSKNQAVEPKTHCSKPQL
jgi:hypothetical protein